MNNYFVDVVVEFERSGKRISIDVPLRQLFFLDRDTVREVCPDGSVVYRLPRHRASEGMSRNNNFDYACLAW